MAQSGLTWECSCGHIELSEIEPEDCLKCGSVGKFIQMPEEIIQEREKDLAENFEEEVLSIKPFKAKKTNSALKKSRAAKSSKTKVRKK